MLRATLASSRPLYLLFFLCFAQGSHTSLSTGIQLFVKRLQYGTFHERANQLLEASPRVASPRGFDKPPREHIMWTELHIAKKRSHTLVYKRHESRRVGQCAWLHGEGARSLIREFDCFQKRKLLRGILPGNRTRARSCRAPVTAFMS